MGIGYNCWRVSPIERVKTSSTNLYRDGSRMPSALELEVAEIHGRTFAEKAAKFL